MWYARLRAFLNLVQLVKNLPAMQETPVRFLGQEDPLEKGSATHSSILWLPLWLSWLRICLQCGRPGFDPWVGKIPWRKERLPTLVFWPGEFHGLYNPWGRKELDTTDRLSLSLKRNSSTFSEACSLLFNENLLLEELRDIGHQPEAIDNHTS